MSKKSEHTLRKSTRLVEARSTIDIEAPTFNILTQTPPSNKNVSPARKGVTAQKKKQIPEKEKKNEAKKITSPPNQKGQKRNEENDLSTFLGQETFLKTLFDVFNNLPLIKVQCQLLCHMLLIETGNVRNDMFIIKINCTELHFGVKEFTVVTGLKCGLVGDFVSNPSISNRLIEKYFGKMNKVPKLDFLNKSKEVNYFEPEDRLNIGVVYFISTFLTVSEESKNRYLKGVLI
ncbi:hypothetical protein R3W88_019347 [Solanum pinnatisectum]|uniref:DUF1985 domain-containing protein n=1 Tax=Solanum pinnatisectum TaxID=50273 RepID=A0AAV9KJ26_9SOLN|nr:hypothetical protein R3W88_019347 [Solanum pinnatisectum]